MSPDPNFTELKDRLKLIYDADEEQYHNDHSLRRYLRAFKTTDAAFQVCCYCCYHIVLHVITK